MRPRRLQAPARRARAGVVFVPLLAGLLLLAGCYDPRLPRCAVRCSATAPCPGELSCGPGGRCNDPAGTCTVASDAGSGDADSSSLDGAVPPDADPDADAEVALVPLSVVVASGGSVTSTPPLLDCAGSCQAWFPVGSAVTLTATAHYGRRFAGWSGACAGTASCTLTLERATDVGASFPATDPGRLWTRHLGGAGHERVGGALLDDAGEATVGASFSAPFDPGLGTLTPAGLTDAVVLRLAADGTPRWALRFGGSGADAVDALAQDASGNLLVALSFAGTVDLGGVTLSASGSSDVALLLLSPAGTILRRGQLGGAGPSNVVALLPVPGGDWVITTSGGDTDFGAGAVPCAGGCLARLSPSFGPRWVKVLGDVARPGLLPDGDLVVALAPRFDVDLGGGTLAARGLVLARLSPDGVHRWSRRYGGGALDFAASALVAVGGDFVVAGTLQGSGDVGGAALPGIGGWSNGFLVRYDGQGDHLWSVHIPMEGNFDVGALARAGNELHLAGGWSGRATIAGTVLTASGIYDGVVATYDLSGNYLRRFVIPASATLSTAAVGSFMFNGAGRSLLTSSFQGTIRPGPAMQTSAGGLDLLLEKGL